MAVVGAFAARMLVYQVAHFCGMLLRSAKYQRFLLLVYERQKLFHPKFLPRPNLDFSVYFRFGVLVVGVYVARNTIARGVAVGVYRTADLLHPKGREEAIVYAGF